MVEPGVSTLVVVLSVGCVLKTTSVDVTPVDEVVFIV